MSRKLTASDRSALIRLAYSLPKGDEVRRVILTAAWDAWEGADHDAMAMEDAIEKESLLRVKKTLDGFDRELLELGVFTGAESGLLPYRVEEKLEDFMNAYISLRTAIGRASR